MDAISHLIKEKHIVKQFVLIYHISTISHCFLESRVIAVFRKKE